MPRAALKSRFTDDQRSNITNRRRAVGGHHTNSRYDLYTVTVLEMMSRIILFLSRRVQNMFRRLGHDHANSGHVLFSLSIIDWINKAATGKIEQVEADYENIASDWLKVEFGLKKIILKSIRINKSVAWTYILFPVAKNKRWASEEKR